MIALLAQPDTATTMAYACLTVPGAFVVIAAVDAVVKWVRRGADAYEHPHQTPAAAYPRSVAAGRPAAASTGELERQPATCFIDDVIEGRCA